MITFRDKSGNSLRSELDFMGFFPALFVVRMKEMRRRRSKCARLLLLLSLRAVSGDVAPPRQTSKICWAQFATRNAKRIQAKLISQNMLAVHFYFRLLTHRWPRALPLAQRSDALFVAANEIVSPLRCRPVS